MDARCCAGIVRRYAGLAFTALVSESGDGGTQATGCATFNTDAFMSGIVRMPPGSFKDEEGVGPNAQVRTVHAMLHAGSAAQCERLGSLEHRTDRRSWWCHASHERWR